jgi:Cu-processing system permease protein
MTVTAIALNTFRESIRDRILYVVGIFGLLLIGSSYVLSPLAIGARHKMVADVGLAAISLLGVVILILMGSNLIHKEVDRRIIFTILSKPVSRHEYLAGKFGGMVMTLGSVVGIMTALYLAVVLADGLPLGPVVFASIGLGFLELVVLTAVTVLFSSFTNSTLTALFTLSVFVMGHLSSDLLSFAGRTGGIVTRIFCTTLFYLLPNLESFNLRAEAVHGLPVSGGDVLLATGYGVSYAAFCLVLAGILFRRKDFR